MVLVTACYSKMQRPVISSSYSSAVHCVVVVRCLCFILSKLHYTRHGVVRDPQSYTARYQELWQLGNGAAQDTYQAALHQKQRNSLVQPQD